jgi:hypothetical protein
MAFTGFRAPALPLPPNDYNRQQFDELFRALRIYFNLIDSLTPSRRSHTGQIASLAVILLAILYQPLALAAGQSTVE